eukprot:Clim_evm47s134 gene=Clim_evmTU47s134
MRQAIRDAVRALWYTVPVCLAFTDCFFSLALVKGDSMQPSLNAESRDNEIILLNKWTARRHNYEKGDVVVMALPDEPRSSVIKRICATHGETVMRREPYIGKVDIPAGHAWMEGDNLRNSKDSNFYGPIPLGMVRAVAVWRLWPLDKAGPIPKHEIDKKRVSISPSISSSASSF